MFLTLHHNQLILKYERPEDANKLLRAPIYKIRIRRYIDQVSESEHSIYFKHDLTIHEIEKIKSILLSKKIPVNIKIDPALQKYVSKKQFHIASRRKVGNDIKKKEKSVKAQFISFKDTVDKIMKRKLNNEQLWNAFYLTTMKKASNFSVPGSGKTATVLGMFAYLKEKDIIDKIIMIGPKNSFGSWIDEYNACFYTHSNFYLNIHDSDIKDTQQRRTALEYNSGNKSLILVNYESVPSLVESLQSIIDDRTLLVFDEVHKIKNPTGQRANAVKEVTHNANFIVALTGTPIPNSYQDIWNLLNILYPEDFKNFFGFSLNELKDPSSHEIEEINNKIKPFFCRISKEQLGVPAANEDIIISSLVSETENKLFKILYHRYKKDLFSLFIRILQLESNPNELLHALDPEEFKYLIDDESDIPEMIDVVDYSEEVVQLIHKLSDQTTTKVKNTITLVNDLTSQGKTVIVWCNLISSMELLQNKFEENNLNVRMISGSVPLEERLSLIQDFKSRKFEVLITNPHTLAESVSLHTACHDAIYFEYSYNLVHLLQSKDRIHRLGLEDDQYTQYYFLQNSYIYNSQNVSIAERVYERLLEKEETMINAIENDILETVTSSEEDLQIIFDSLE